MGSYTQGSDVIVVTISRSCAKQLLLALTLALGGTPIKLISKGKGKGKGKGGGGKATGTPPKKYSGKTATGKTQVGKTQVGKSQAGKSQSGKKKSK
ncbi:MAG TPA: hypothetical protein VNN08_00230 [Thermoanaerobaculia bacterium]|nr:hypothetical protein [Thermoanaerobaculia bacterium]